MCAKKHTNIHLVDIVRMLAFSRIMRIGVFEKLNVDEIGSVWIARCANCVFRVAFKGSEKELLSRLPDDVVWRRVKSSKSQTRPCSIRRIAVLKPEIRTGTPFQRSVWRAIASIPRGEVRSYAWLARKAGRPKAIRAAASACGANPVPTVVPCHRVVASDGSIGGFSGGLAIKRKLLKLEGHRFER